MNWIDDVKDLWDKMDSRDQKMVYRDSRAFYDLLAKPERIDPYCEYINGELASAMLVIDCNSCYSIMSFTNPDYRGRGLQKKLLNQIKHDYQGDKKPLYVKVKNDNYAGWANFWIKQGFEPIEKNNEYIACQLDLSGNTKVNESFHVLLNRILSRLN